MVAQRAYASSLRETPKFPHVHLMPRSTSSSFVAQLATPEMMGAAGGIFPPTMGALNPPRRLHLPGSHFGTLQACTLPSYATAATRETGSWRGICKFADPSYQDLVLV